MTTAPPRNVVSLLAAVAARCPARPALLAADGRVTYGELWSRVDRCSVGLRTAGLKPGDRCICMVPMSVDLYVILLGILKAGGVAVFVDPWIGMHQIAAFAAFAEPRAFVGVAKSHLLRLLQPALRHIPIGVTMGRRVGRLPARLALADLLTAPGDGAIHATAESDSALITFTSGSSGTPKGANRTHGFLNAQHTALKHEFPMHETDVDLTMFPVFALNNLAQGVTTVIPRIDFRRVADISGADVLAQIRAYGVTTCTGSPPFFDRLVEAAPGLALRRILTGGAPVSDTQLRRWRAAWPQTEIVVVYGSTEAEPVAHMDAAARLALEPMLHAAAPGFCTGRPTALLRTRVIRITKGPVVLGPRGWPAWEVPHGTVGELVVMGAHVCRDYFRNATAAAENKIVDADNTIWHRMGDTGYVDPNGRFWLVGRVHSTIVRDGTCVHPQLLEQAVAGPDVRQAAAVGLPDAQLGERVVLVVVPADSARAGGRDSGEPMSRAAWEEHCRRRVSQAGLVADEIRIVREPLPVDPRHNAKIDYAALRNRLRGAP